MGMREVGSPELQYSSMENYQTGNGQTFFEPDPTALGFFNDTFANFFNGPFGYSHKPLENPYTGGISYPASIAGQGSNLAFPEQLPYEPERPFAAALVHSILTRAWSVPLDPKGQQEVSTNVNFLLTTARIRKLLSMYFKYWHPSCAIIHIPSFNMESVPLPLLASLVFMGAMYSNDEMEVHAAKRLLDFAELFIFSSSVFACENEIGATFCGNRSPDDPMSDWVQFQNFQAGFLIVVVQYWAGSRASRNRVMETRFSEVVQVCFTLLQTGTANFWQLVRRMGLVKARHLPQDNMHEYLWIQQESRIRYDSSPSFELRLTDQNHEHYFESRLCILVLPKLPMSPHPRGNGV